jgi:hypothetical protein
VPVGCRISVLPSVNDPAALAVSATVNVGRAATLVPSPAALSSVAPSAANGATILAATATASGGTGSFSATTLSPSGSWSVGGSTGDFQWTYPLRTPRRAAGRRRSCC